MKKPGLKPSILRLKELQLSLNNMREKLLREHGQMDATKIMQLKGSIDATQIKLNRWQLTLFRQGKFKFK